MLYYLVMTFFTVLCFVLGFFILLQQGKGDMGLGTMGGGSFELTRVGALDLNTAVALSAQVKVVFADGAAPGSGVKVKLFIRMDYTASAAGRPGRPAADGQRHQITGSCGMSGRWTA